MKKILVMILMLFPFAVKAEGTYYDSVNVETSFEQNVDLNSVGGFTIEISDADNNKYEFELNKDNQYKTSIKNLFTYSDLKAEISGNDGVNYTFSVKVDYSDDMNPIIRVLVNGTVTSTTSNVSEEVSTTMSYTEQEIEAAQKALAARKTDRKSVV